MKGVAIFISKKEAGEFSYDVASLSDSPKIFWENKDKPKEFVWFDGKKARPILDYLVEEYIPITEGLKRFPWLFL